MYLLTNKSRRKIPINGEEIERNKSIEIANDKWDELRVNTEIRDLLIYGKLTAEKVEKKK